MSQSLSCKDAEEEQPTIAIRKREITAEEISKTLDSFGSCPPYEFWTRGTRCRSGENMLNQLDAKLGQHDILKTNSSAESTERQNESCIENSYLPAISKEVLESEWYDLFGSSDYKGKLQNLALAGKLRDCRRFRGVCWRIFLDCLHDDVDKWLETTSQQRTKYETLKSKYLTDPYSAEPTKGNIQVFNPLSQDADSPWTQYFEDRKLNNVILQDLDRLFPGMHYFQSKKIRNILLHILFCYARKNPHVGYKQGMHEILAPLVFVLEYDSEVFPFLEDSDNLLMKELINPAYLESDAFTLFDHLMDIIEPWYCQIESPAVPSKQIFNASGPPFMEQQSTTPPTAIIRKLNKIQESMLKKYDRVLYNHLRDFEIEPQLYGLRWVRLLFGREFTTMEDILTLWDALFSDGVSLDLVDYVYISLICNRRRKLLSSDHSGCLTALMKTPFSKRGAKSVVLEARHIRDTKLDPTRKAPDYYQPRYEPKPMVKIEFPTTTTETSQGKITSGLQAVLRGNRQSPSKKAPDVKHPDMVHSKKSDGHREPQTEERKRPVELKANNKSAPSFHMFPHDPDDEDLFTSSRSRTSSATFLSKLSSKVRNPSKTDLATLQQDHERLQAQVSQFKAEVDKLQSISVYCGKKMDAYINILQEQVTRNDGNMDVIYLSIAGLKQVRDILKGTLSFQTSTVEQDSEFSHIDSVIASINPTFNSSTDSSNSDYPGSLPVPLLADFGHFERQDDQYILVEANDNNENKKQVSLNYTHGNDSENFETDGVTSHARTVELNDDGGTSENTQASTNLEP